MKRISALILALLLVPILTFAGQIQGTLQTPTGGTVNNGTLTFTLSQAALVPGSSSIVPSTVSCYTSNTGIIVGVPDAISLPVVSTNTASGTLASGTYYVKITYWNGTGESAASPEKVVVLSAQGTLIIQAPTVQPANASGYKVYISSAAGTEKLQGTVTGWTNFSQSSALVSVTSPPANNTSSCSLRFSDELIPTGTYYTVNLLNVNGSQFAGYPQTWCTYGGAGGVINVSNGAPTGNCGTNGVFYPTPILAVPAAPSQSIQGDLNLTGTFTSQNAVFNSVVFNSGNFTGDVLFSTPSVVNVLSNKYGATLVADGTTDNCSAWSALQMAVLAAHPTGGIAYYFPSTASKYHFNPASCIFGIVLNSDNVGIVGDPLPYWDGTNIHGSVVDVPINANSHKGNFVIHMGTDCRAMGATSPCDGVSSGAPVITGGGLVVDDYVYVGTHLTNPAHAVLSQSGPDSRITNVRAYSVFHGVAVRSPRTNVSNIHLTDTFDFVVKSDVGSGSVWGVNVSNLICDSSVLFTGDACQFIITSNANTVTTYNVNLINASFNDAPYNFVINAENGGTVENVTASNISGFQTTGTAIYSYTTTSGSCNNINISNSTFLNATVPPVFLNTLNCVNFNPHGVRGNGIQIDNFQSYLVASGSPGLVFNPVADGHESDIEIAGQNAAGNVNLWTISKGGTAAFSVLGVSGLSTFTGGVKAGGSGSTISDSRELIQSAHSCGTTTTCANTANGSNRMIFGTVALTSATPSTAVVSGISPAFTSTTSYVCTLTNMTTQANPVKVTNTSTSSFTITGPNTVTDTVAYQCVGN